MKKPAAQTCPCCGLPRNSWKVPKNVTLLTCPACAFIEGTDSPTAYRNGWIRLGMGWNSPTVKAPKNWNPLNTLGRLALSATQARTRGRPPRMN